MIKRSYTVTVTIQSGSPIVFEGEVAHNFWAMYENFKRGNDVPVGFTYYTPNTEGTSSTATTLLFKNVVSVVRSPISAETVENAVPTMPFTVQFEEQPAPEEVKSFQTEAERRAYLKGKQNVTPVTPSAPSKEDDKTQQGEGGTTSGGETQ